MAEILTPQAQALVGFWQNNQYQYAAPVLFSYELTSVARKAVAQKRLTVSEGRIVRDKMLEFPVQLHFDDALLKRAYDLAEQLNRPSAYDAQYLALAERLGCDFWTADEKLFNAVGAALASVRWLGTFSS
jgi:predicted nucleic acid-binding protein